jgi:hypothetical protein
MRAGRLVVVVVMSALAGCTDPDPTPAPLPSAPAAPELDPLFVCGRGIFADDVERTRGALTVAFASVRRVSAATNGLSARSGAGRGGWRGRRAG